METSIVTGSVRALSVSFYFGDRETQRKAGFAIDPLVKGHDSYKL
ncbi:hypothetical protein [Ammoniphilus sp. YIM 78166]|nr:hypothetical protein [Ammoniphilus sp. YIM 78166]